MIRISGLHMWSFSSEYDMTPYTQYGNANYSRRGSNSSPHRSVFVFLIAHRRRACGFGMARIHRLSSRCVRSPRIHFFTKLHTFFRGASSVEQLNCALLIFNKTKVKLIWFFCTSFDSNFELHKTCQRQFRRLSSNASKRKLVDAIAHLGVYWIGFSLQLSPCLCTVHLCNVICELLLFFIF